MARLGRSQPFAPKVKAAFPIEFVLAVGQFDGTSSFAGVGTGILQGAGATDGTSSFVGVGASTAAATGNTDGVASFIGVSNAAAPVVTVAADPSDGVGGEPKRRRQKLKKPYDELIQEKRDKEAQDHEDLQAILEGRAPRILKPAKPNKVQQAKAKARALAGAKELAVIAANDDDEDEAIEMLLLYG